MASWVRGFHDLVAGLGPWWQGWGLFFWCPHPILVLDALTARFEHLGVLLAHQGPSGSVATSLLRIDWLGILLAFASAAFDGRVAPRLCILVLASIAIVMPLTCGRRPGYAGPAEPVDEGAD